MPPSTFLSLGPPLASPPGADKKVRAPAIACLQAKYRKMPAYTSSLGVSMGVLLEELKFG